MIKKNYYITCDKCGEGYGEFDDYSSKHGLMDDARKDGWVIGDDGDYCPDCVSEMNETADDQDDGDGFLKKAAYENTPSLFG